MGLSFTPDFMFRKITEITPDFLREEGITLLLMDLDNTMTPYKTREPSMEILKWINTLKDSGITLYIMSNSKTDRPEIFAGKLGIGYTMKAGKPSVKSILKTVSEYGCKPQETALVGDQIFTDVLGANRAEIKSILVYPIKFSNPLYKVRYFIELPFRHSKKRRD